MLAAARAAGGCAQGAADELNVKGLLALNLRKLGAEAPLLAPRSYVLLPAPATGPSGEEVRSEAAGADAEFAAFVADFRASRALAILKRVAAAPAGAPDPAAEPEPEPEPEPDCDSQRPEGLWDREIPVIPWEPPPSRRIDEACVTVALAVAARCAAAAAEDPALFPTHGAAAVTDAEWETLRSARLTAPLLADAAGSTQREAAQLALAALPPSCQLALLRDNVWLLKPSLNGGGNGRGILLLDRLPVGSGSTTVPALLLAWAASVGRSGSGGLNDMKHGILLQKAVERPHLLNRELLMQHWPTGYPLPSQPLPPPSAAAADATELYKYNWRVWVLGSLVALPSPAAYLHTEGYIDMCGLPYTPALVPGAQVSNQMGGHAERGYSRFQRQWDVRAFGQCLSLEAAAAAAVAVGKEEGRDDPYGSVLQPQVAAIIAAVFRALETAPSSLLERTHQELVHTYTQSKSPPQLEYQGWMVNPDR